ncbi:MAG: bifunctional phosphopantothenoylcysteine decarboxylase/phosphopantothenate--cysteine ligase CoaBC [Deltaproteobacteria bacterium]|nr:bifunctional phosphopantothenoylcysteine decarboxylase/phosphopantothenate--cysteine ligase CoaBC [Deltaproteobacteria bacterium]
MHIKGKRILLGVSGGIAAYKSAFLLRELMKRGALVKVAMTSAAQKFVTPLTFQTLSGEEVITDTFQETVGYVLHVAMAEWADLVAVVPATANIIGKLANGIADDFLTTLALATRAKLLVCPAMNSNMLLHPAVQKNLNALIALGYSILPSGTGDLACKTEGPGRLAEVEDILAEIEHLLSPKDFQGIRFLISASRTEEYLDPVRCLTNRSSGRMGFAVAKAALRRGGEVCLVTGPSEEADIKGVRTIRVVSAREMREAMLAEYEASQVVIKTAAVSDFRPAREPKAQKIKREATEPEIRLTENPDILRELGQKKTHQCLVGFAAESEALLMHANRKMKNKNLDFIVANDITQDGCGFRCSTNKVKIIHRDGRVDDIPFLEKIETAHMVLDRVRTWILERDASGMNP